MNYRDKLIRTIHSLDNEQLERLHLLCVEEFGDRGAPPQSEQAAPELEALFTRFQSDWARLNAHLASVADILSCKETFVEILAGDPANNNRVHNHVKASMGLVLAMQDIIYLMDYHETDRMEFDIREGFQFQCGSYGVSRDFFRG